MPLNTSQINKWDAIAREFGEIDAAPEKDVLAFLNAQRTRVERRGLDLGCGCGRHAIEGARLGLRMSAVDWSSVACCETSIRAKATGVDVDVRRASMLDLPYAREAFDFVVAWCVLNHGTRFVFETALEEAFRVLKRDGALFGLVMTAKDARRGLGREVDKDCYVFEAGLEKGIIHFFPEREEVVEMLSQQGQVVECRDVTFGTSDIQAYHPSVDRSWHLLFQVMKL